ncbi:MULTISPECIES: hypothetical protein [Cyanophyceae]|uniref:hypothetical protein n=1 Tax=Cyanophyceae TaxID=3028117 RepID=UPI0018EFC941|nr:MULTISPECIES: hypothetical protein [Cyanophyceae]
MPKSSSPSQQRNSQTEAYSAANPISRLYQAGYQQALSDFAVTDLLNQICTHLDDSDAAWSKRHPQAAETLAAILIQAVTANLNGNILAIYLESIRHCSVDTYVTLAKLSLSSPSTDLPPTFPEVEVPHFLYGDRLCWTSRDEITDWGIVIGRFYGFAPHCCGWRWCYLIWLDSNSPSAAWVNADIAWEDDLEPLETALSL